jgi:hypothetical protein
MKRLFLIFSICLSIATSAQKTFKVPDFEKIKQDISDSNSIHYYPIVLERFLSGGDGLTLAHYYNFYYGYRYQERYSPYGMSKHREAINKLLDKKKKSEKDNKKLIALLEEQLRDNPIKIMHSYLLALTYQDLGDEELAKKWFNNTYGLADAILLTGDGLSLETAIWVLHTSEEYDLIPYLGYKFGGEQALVNNCDRMKLQKNEDELEHLYFNVSVLFESFNLD